MEDHKITILVVDDEKLVRDVLSKILTAQGYQTLTAEDGASALKLNQSHSIDITLLDDHLPDTHGIELMDRLKSQSPFMLFIMITGYGTIERAVEAMSAGAWDFISKPVTANMLIEKVQRIEEVCILRREKDYRTRVLQGEFEFPGVIGPSQVMKSIYESILRASENDLPVLIEGETGSGKEYIAEAIHLNSKRRSKPFVIMDCTATPSSLIESVLFGSTKGAFTGAVERNGLLKEADSGTLFLDEIGEIELEMQPKLLRGLETKRFRPVGSTKEVESNFRLLCATNRNLKEEIKNSNFRMDLYYRISAQKISLPSLRDRKPDIPVLANHFLQEIAVQHGRSYKTLTPKAMQLLKAYSWPGNIRQLKFTIEAAYFNARDANIDVEDLNIDDKPSDSAIEKEAAPFGDISQDFKSYRESAILEAERHYVTALLEQSEGDIREAAKMAGLTRESFYRIISRCGVSATDFRPGKSNDE